MRSIKFKSICFIYCLLASINAFADVTIDDINYSLNIGNRTAAVSGSSLSDIVLPETITYDGVTYTVTTIGSWAFSNRTLETIKLSPSVKVIGNDAFHACRSLRHIDLGSVNKIGQDAFDGCSSLNYIVLPRTIQSVISFFDGSNSNRQIICLNEGFNTGYPSITIYPSSFYTINCSPHNYDGNSPEVTYIFNGVGAGFQPTSEQLDEMNVNVGQHAGYLKCSFANSFLSFDVDIRYIYTITPATLTAKTNDASRLYGDVNPTFTATYSGFVNGEDASVVTSHGNFSTVASATSNVGTYPIKQTGATAQNYVFEYEEGTLTVNKAPLAMTANDKTMTYGGVVPTLDARYEGLKNNETVPVWTTEPQLSTTATSKSKAAQYPITISNAVAKNYDLTIHNGTLTIEKAPLTAKVDNKSRLYGDANPEFTLTYNGLKNGETVPEWSQQPSFETDATEKSNVGSYPVSLKNVVAVNYDITPVDGTLTVNKAPLKITPKDYTRKYGEQNPAFELNYEGLKNSENQPEWTQDPVFMTNATAGSSVGEYAITVKSAEARNYTLVKGSGTLTVTKAPLTIKLMDATRKYGTANPNFEMAYTGLVNYETTPAWTSYPTITTTAKEKSDVGDYPITAEGGEMKNYAFDGITPGVLSVTPASLVVRAQDASKSYFEENPTLSYLCTGFVQGDNADMFTVKPQLTTTATMQSPAGIYPIEVSGAEIKNYQLSYEKGQLTIDKRTLTVSTGDYTRAYGKENPEFELHYKGFVNNEDEKVLVSKPKASTIADKNTDTGVYDITIGNGVAENYAFTYVGGKLTIEKAYQTLTWDQELTGIELYDQVELTATASSGLEVQYTLQDYSVCSLVRIGTKQYLDCYGEGEAVLIAQQEGNNNYWQTPKMYKTVKIGIDTSIETLMMQMDGTEQIFDANGRRLQKLQRGVNIVRMKDGTTRKMVLK